MSEILVSIELLNIVNLRGLYSTKYILLIYYYFLKYNFFLLFKEKKTGRRQLKCMSNVTDERESVSILHIILCCDFDCKKNSSNEAALHLDIISILATLPLFTLKILLFIMQEYCINFFKNANVYLLFFYISLF